MNFEELGLLKELADTLKSHGITTPSEIQQLAFPILNAGDSIIALSKTGTGKTLAYLAPLVQRHAYDLAADTPPNQTWGLVLVPTRELADQAEKNLRLLTADRLQAVVIVGGESEKKQISIGEKAAIYIATPGRFLDLLERKLVDVSHLKCVVFDEADRILDMGFVNDIRTIRRKLPSKLQLCFFSATIHFGVDEMAYEFGVEAKRVGKEEEDLTVEGLDHRVAFVGDEEKFHALVNFLKIRLGQRGIVFTNFRERAQELVYRLQGLGLRTELLTAKLSQAERTRTMQNFRDNKTQVLIASDLASRGLDVQNIDFVVNMALPEDSATYLHRVGRTARAGKKGIALSLVGFDDSYRLEALEKFLGKPIERFEFFPEELSGPIPRLSTRPEQAPRNDSSPTQRAPYVKTQQAPHPRRESKPAPKAAHHVSHQTKNKAPTPKKVATSGPLSQITTWIKSFVQKSLGMSKKAEKTSVTNSETEPRRTPYQSNSRRHSSNRNRAQHRHPPRRK